MKNLKKTVITTILTGAVILSATACGNSTPATTTVATTTTTASASGSEVASSAAKGSASESTSTSEDNNIDETVNTSSEATSEQTNEISDTETSDFDISGKIFEGYSADDEGNYTVLSKYYTFNEDGSGTIEDAEGPGVSFNYELDGENVLMHLGSAEDNTLCTLEYDADGNLYININYEDSTDRVLLKESEGTADSGSGEISETTEVSSEDSVAAMAELDPLLGNFAAVASTLPFEFTYKISTEQGDSVTTMAIAEGQKAYISTNGVLADGTEQTMIMLIDGTDMYMLNPTDKTGTKIPGSDTQSSIDSANVFNVSDVSGYSATRETAEIDGVEYTAVHLTNSDNVETVYYFDADENLKFFESAGVRGEVLKFNNEVDDSLFVVPADYTVTEFSMTDGTGDSTGDGIVAE